MIPEIHTLTAEQAAHIEKLKLDADAATYHSAVVDYLGFRGDDGELITVASPPEVRYGVRSMQHVKVYKFQAVYLNRAAREAMG